MFARVKPISQVVKNNGVLKGHLYCSQKSIFDSLSY